MRFPVSLTILSAVATLVLCADPRARAQGQSTVSQTAGTGTYIVADPLANVRYDNKYDISVGMAYAHMKAGPNLTQGANLGGINLSGSYWLSKRWAIEGSGRGYFGTSGAAPNPYDIRGPFVMEYFFVGGPEWLGPHNKHGAILAHALVGGVYGNFEKDLRGGQSPSVVGFYNNQVAFASVIGGHFDLNRSARWVFRVTPDANITHYGVNYGNKAKQWDVNFAISVGAEYRFKQKRR